MPELDAGSVTSAERCREVLEDFHVAPGRGIETSGSALTAWSAKEETSLSAFRVFRVCLSSRTVLLCDRPASLLKR